MAAAPVRMAGGLDAAALLVAATSLAVTERHYTRMLCACRLLPFITEASGGAWTWEDIGADENGRRRAGGLLAAT
jgi:hypothetical protein